MTARSTIPGPGATLPAENDDSWISDFRLDLKEKGKLRRQELGRKAEDEFKKSTETEDPATRERARKSLKQAISQIDKMLEDEIEQHIEHEKALRHWSDAMIREQQMIWNAGVHSNGQSPSEVRNQVPNGRQRTSTQGARTSTPSVRTIPSARTPTPSALTSTPSVRASTPSPSLNNFPGRTSLSFLAGIIPERWISDSPLSRRMAEEPEVMSDTDEEDADGDGDDDEGEEEQEERSFGHIIISPSPEQRRSIPIPNSVQESHMLWRPSLESLKSQPVRAMGHVVGAPGSSPTNRPEYSGIRDGHNQSQKPYTIPLSPSISLDTAERIPVSDAEREAAKIRSSEELRQSLHSARAKSNLGQGVQHSPSALQATRPRTADVEQLPRETPGRGISEPSHDYTRPTRTASSTWTSSFPGATPSRSTSIALSNGRPPANESNTKLSTSGWSSSSQIGSGASSFPYTLLTESEWQKRQETLARKQQEQFRREAQRQVHEKQTKSAQSTSKEQERLKQDAQRKHDQLKKKAEDRQVHQQQEVKNQQEELRRCEEDIKREKRESTEGSTRTITILTSPAEETEEYLLRKEEELMQRAEEMDKKARLREELLLRKEDELRQRAKEIDKKARLREENLLKKVKELGQRAEEMDKKARLREEVLLRKEEELRQRTEDIKKTEEAMADRQESQSTATEQQLQDVLNYLSRMIGRMITNVEWDRIEALPVAELHAVMDILQKLIDGEYEDYRLLERFLKKLVRRSEILPSYLFLSGVCRLGNDPIFGGGYADIYKGQNDDKIVALKVLRIYVVGADRDRLHREFCKEAMIWRQLKDSNILPFYGVCEDVVSSRFAMVSPWMENGNMVTYLKEHDGADRMKIVEGVAFGLRYLHTLTPEVVHGDLRGANILMDDSHRPRIADFGLSRIIDIQYNSMTVTSFNGKGNTRWQAPELLDTNRLEGAMGVLTSKSDVYAYACVCLEAFAGEAPFSNLRDGAIVFEVAVHDRRPARPSGEATRRGLDDSMWNLMNDCWKTDPAERPDMSKVVNRLALDGRQP